MVGLDTHLDAVRGRILATTPLPNVQSVYATVCVEENCQEAMLDSESTMGTTFVVNNFPKKGIHKCTHCSGDNHVMETCFKPHGYPDWHPKGKTTPKTTCPYSPQQNGVFERKNRHILEVTRSLLINGNVPSHLWGEAVRSAVYLINRTPSSVLNFRRPLDVLSDHCILPFMVSLPPHIFGCVICKTRGI